MKIEATKMVMLLAVLAPAGAACGDPQGQPSAVGGSSAAGSGGAALGGAAGTSPGSGGSAGNASGGVAGTATGGSAGNPLGGVSGGGSSGTGAGTENGGSSAGIAGGAGTGASGDGGTSGMGGEGGSSSGAGPQGGMAGGGRGGSGGAAGVSGSGGSNGCVRGQTEPSEVILIGDSFIALNRSITNQVQSRARAAGALGQDETYRDVSRSGATLAGNNQIPSQYSNAANASPVEVVLMDGGGNDCIGNNPNGAFDAATALFQTMGQEGTDVVVYFFYPDPVGSNWANLKSCLDGLRPRMKALCEGLTAPKCYFMDLRTVWQPSYAQMDGIHPTEEGGRVVGDAVWATMQEHCIAQ